jgi:SEFIR domain
MITEFLPIKVFISYSHDSQAHKERVLALADRLRDDGIDCNIDQYEQSPLEGWQRWMINEVEAADLVLVVCSETYNRRFRGDENAGKGKGVSWEGSVIIQELYDVQGLNSKFIPIILTADDSKFIPSPLSSTTCYSLIVADDYELLYRRLTNQHSTPKQELGKPPKLDKRERHPLFSDILPIDSNSINLTLPTLTLSKSFKEFLENTGIKFTHRNREYVSLDDLFIFPDLRIANESLENTSMSISGDNLWEHNERLLIFGDEQSGKTTLAKRLFIDALDRGFLPVLVNGEDLKDSNLTTINN